MQTLPSSITKKFARYPIFYQQVWRVCYAIPKGQTRTYGWIAQQIGRPRGARAVGMALKNNPFAPLIPCHRVVRSDGGLGGYSGRGGLETKKRLLNREKAFQRIIKP